MPQNPLYATIKLTTDRRTRRCPDGVESFRIDRLRLLWLLIIQANTSGQSKHAHSHTHRHIHSHLHTNFKWLLATIIALIDGQSNPFQSLCRAPCKMQAHVSVKGVVYCVPLWMCVCLTIYSYSLVALSFKCDVGMTGQTIERQAESGSTLESAIK